MKHLYKAIQIMAIGQAAILVASCTGQKSTQLAANPLILDAQKIISTRPQNTDIVLTVLKLKNPALLEHC